jgi:oligopeptidase B
LSLTSNSAGGLTAAAAVNETGNKLFNSMILNVPFVDAITAMCDPNLPLTLHEYEEWGNMNEVTPFEALCKIDPYLNLKDQTYPHILITASLLDQRVPYWQPLKYIAKLQSILEQRKQRKKMEKGKGKKGRDGDAFLLIDVAVGHGGDGGLYTSLNEKAIEVAFLLHKLPKKNKKGDK